MTVIGIVIALLALLLLLFDGAIYFVLDYLDKITWLLGHIACTMEDALFGPPPDEEQ